MPLRRATSEEILNTLEKIRISFRGVFRGVSWHEAYVIDNYGDSVERGKARTLDKDRNWEDVANDPAWKLGGPWCFLDAHGFRYYMAAAMTKCLRECRDGEGGWDLWFHFDTHKDEFRKQAWAEFTNEQLWVTAEFVLMMSRANEDVMTRREWRRIYESSWQRLHTKSLRQQRREKRP